jgi:hypothetical protein
VNFLEPNPNIDFSGLILTLCDEPLLLPDAARNCAGVNSFGFPTIAHIRDHFDPTGQIAPDPHYWRGFDRTRPQLYGLLRLAPIQQSFDATPVSRERWLRPARLAWRAKRPFASTILGATPGASGHGGYEGNCGPGN